MQCKKCGYILTIEEIVDVDRKGKCPKCGEKELVF